ncbi:MAG: RNA ligase family protein [Desulfobacteraceae bacterium]|jgi:hypothetical protein
MTRYKYPRTPHLPWSPGITSDDKVLKDVSCLEGKKLVGTIKMDGENTTMYRDRIHARSIDSKDHESRHWVKQLHAKIRHLILPGWRICGENLYAKHSIYYDDLPSYFLFFSVWSDNNVCLEWVETLMTGDELGLYTPICFTPPGITSLKEVDALFQAGYSDHEGYVVRIEDEFEFEDFGKSVAKYVRANHVQTDRHWMRNKIVKNKLLR